MNKKTFQRKISERLNKHFVEILEDVKIAAGKQQKGDIENECISSPEVVNLPFMELKEQREHSQSKSSLEVSATENQQLKKQLQEIEEKMQTDDMKVSVKAESEAKEDFERLQKKYDKTRRLCNLRNDEISVLKTKIADEVERLSNKYLKTRDLCQMRTDKLNELRERFGVTVDNVTKENEL